MIYIHIPYCHHKCTYCAFYSNAGRREEQQAYVEAVCEELRQRSGEQTDHPIRTIYFGGGTPTLLPIELLSKIVATLRNLFDLSQLEEATIEANPENLTSEYLEALSGLHFFNRISIGIQSFNANDLKLFNRVHTPEQALDAIRNARQAGFHNISADLIYGIPGQTLSTWKENLQQIFALPVTHLSCYALSLEPQSILWRQVESGKIAMPEEEAVLEAYELLLQEAKAHGFGQYEISNFCKPGMPSRHNSRYWDRTPYLGIGAAAHSFDGKCRRWNVADTRHYIHSISNNENYYESERLTEIQSFNEYIMTALRTTAGIDKSALPKIAARIFDKQFRPAVERQIHLGLLTETPTHIIPTHDGLLQADGIATKLMVDE